MIVNQAALQGISVGFKTIFNKVFNETTPVYTKIATRVTSETGEENYKWLGKLPRMKEWIGEREIQNLAAADYTIKNKKFESTFAVDRDDIEDDRIGMYAPVIQDTAQLAATFPDDLTFNILKNGFKNKCYDGTPFFGIHPVGEKKVTNKIKDKLSVESYVKARTSMMSFKDEEGNSLKIIPDLLVVPPALEGEARKILMADMINNTNNVYKGTAELLVVPELAGNDEAWYLLCTGKSLKPLIYQERKKPTFVAMVDEKSENVFMLNQYMYGVDARANVGYGFWQMAFASDGSASA